MNKTLVISSFALSFILATTLIGVTSKNIVSAFDLSSLKDKAASMFGVDNSSSSISTNAKTNASPSITDNSTSSGSSLKEKATNMIGNLLK